MITKIPRPEARVERDVLLALGQIPQLCLYRNETGHGHPANVGRKMEAALADRRFAEARAIALDILNRNRITFGLGTGSPDLVGCLSGRFVGLELKSRTGKVSPEQKQWHDAARLHGALIHVVRSPEEAEAFIRQAQNEWVAW